MPALPKSTFAESALAAALNRLLDAQPGALSRLQRHAGKTLRLVLPLLPLDLTLDDTSRFRPASETSEAASASPAEPALTLTPAPSALPLWLSGGQLADLFRFEGDDQFAADLSGALADFDWVLALRPYLGDIAASRVEQFLRGFGAWREQAVQAAGRNLAEYAVYEQAMLAEPHAARAFIGEVDALREEVDRLEARLRLFESQLESDRTRLMYFFRLLRIFLTASRYGLDEFFLGHERVKLIRWAGRGVIFLAQAEPAARRASAPGAGIARPDLRQVRPDAVHPARHDPARHRRRTGQAAGPRAALPERPGAGGDQAGLRQGRERCIRRIRKRPRWPPPRWRRCTGRA